MTSSIDPIRSLLSLYTACPRIWRLALQPRVTSRSSATLTPRTVDPATCAYETAGAVKAIPASIKMRMGFMASSTFGQSGLRALGFLGLDAADDSVKNGTLCLLN